MTRSRGSALPALATALGVAGRRLTWITILLVLLLVCTAHLPLRHSEYIQDDHLAVEFNPIVQRGNPAEILSTSYWAGAKGDDRRLYRPLTIFSFALERKLTLEPNPLLSQVVNIGLHLLASLSLLLLIRRLGAGHVAAAAGALIFAVHPVHVEAVANIVGRSEIMASLFSFVGLVLLSLSGPWRNAGRAIRPSPGRARLAAWGAAAALLLALGAKELALATLPLYVALELLFRPRGDGGREFWIDRAAALAPSALAALIYLWLRVRALETLFGLQETHPMDNPLLTLEGVQRAATALGLVARYLKLLLFPFGLSADYSGPVIAPERSLLAPLPLIGALFLSTCVVLALRPVWRRSRDPLRNCWAFAALLFLLPYLVIGNLLFNVGTIFGERLIYFPSAGYCFLCGLILGAMAAGRFEPRENTDVGQHAVYASRLAVLALATWLAAFTVMTWTRCRDWKNDETLFRAAVATQPNSPRAQFIVGRLEAERGEYETALRFYDRTTELYHDYSGAWKEKGVVMGHQELYGAAEQMLRTAVTISPTYADAHALLGIALRRLRRYDEAHRSLRRAILLDSTCHVAWTELGNYMLARRNYAGAVNAYRKAVSLGRKDVVDRLREAERLSRENP